MTDHFKIVENDTGVLPLWHSNSVEGTSKNIFYLIGYWFTNVCRCGIFPLLVIHETVSYSDEDSECVFEDLSRQPNALTTSMDNDEKTIVSM